MDMTLRIFVGVGVLIVGVFIVGCGGDDEADSSTPTVEKKPALSFGLDGDTYRNRRLFKISDLPVDDWTVKEVTNRVLGEQVKVPGVVINEVISLLLMQPTSEADFADTLEEAFKKGIPYIYIGIEVQRATDIKSSREVGLTLLKQIGFQDNEVTDQG